MEVVTECVALCDYPQRGHSPKCKKGYLSMAGKIYEYAVLYHPKSRKVGDEKTSDPSKLLVDVKRVIAQDEKSVAILAAREIPEDYLDKLEQVEIAIRPF